MELLAHLGLPLDQISMEAIAIKAYGWWVLVCLALLCGLVLFLRFICFVVGRVFLQMTKVEAVVAHHFWRVVRQISMVSIDGGDLPHGVVISNHPSLVDFIVLSHNCPQYFTWFHIWHVPSLHGIWNMARADENWKLSPMAEYQLSPHVEPPIVLFPEVNVFSNSALSVQNLYSQLAYGPQYSKVLHPRYMAVANMQRMAGGHRWYDATIRYNQPTPPTLIDAFTKPITATVRWEPVEFAIREKRMRRQLEQIWQRKDQRLSTTEVTEGLG